MAESSNQSPDSPIHRKIFDCNEAKEKLKYIIGGAELSELPLDYLNTTSFGDLYLFDRVLGSGTFGVVLKAIEKDTGNEYAIKVYFQSYTMLRSSINTV